MKLDVYLTSHAHTNFILKLTGYCHEVSKRQNKNFEPKSVSLILGVILLLKRMLLFLFNVRLNKLKGSYALNLE